MLCAKIFYPQLCSYLAVFFQVCSYLVFDAFTELFITMCIFVNVLFMAGDQYSVEYDGM